MKKELTLKEKTDLLTKDFLERDGNDHFVRIRRNGRLGWESTLDEESPYSEYFLHPKSKEELIKNAYGLASDMIKVMNTPFKVKIKITNTESSTNSRVVNVATKVFDEDNLSIGQKLDTFIGLTIHEGCHLLYTNFGELAKIQNETVKTLENIIEDERIERECGEYKPGLANFLKSAKYYYFDLYDQKMKNEGRTNGLNTFSRLLNCIISFVRYPKSLEIKDLEEFVDVMLQVKEVLLPFPRSTEETIIVAKKIYDIIEKFLKKEKKKEKEKEKKDRKQTDNSRTQQECSDDAKKEIEEGLKAMKDALSEIVKEANSNTISSQEQSETVKEDKEEKGRYCEGSVDLGKTKGTYIEKAKENEDIYNDSLSRVKHFVPAISKILKFSSLEYKTTLRGMRSGVLDTGKLAEAFQGVPTVYIKDGQVKVEKLSVCILIDESGSMWGSGEIAARDTAILLNEALKDVPNVNLFIYGHTATNYTTNIYVYREGPFNKKYTLGTTDARAGNHDSVAIREVAARVRKNTSDKVLFFLISDGAPNESPELVKKAVKDVEKQGFEIVAISIDPYYDPKSMYDHNVIFSDLQRLAPELGKMVKNAVMKNQNKQLNY